MDFNSGQLYRSFLNGSQPTMLVSSGIRCSGDLLIISSPTIATELNDYCTYRGSCMGLGE